MSLDGIIGEMNSWLGEQGRSSKDIASLQPANDSKHGHEVSQDWRLL